MRIISILNSKGGVGKTFFSINLANALAKLNQKVTLIDANFISPQISNALGIFGKYYLNDFVFENVNLRNCLYYLPYGFKVIPSKNFLDSFNFSVFNVLFNQLIDDFIIIDTQSGIDKNLINLIQISSDLILITDSDKNSIYECLKILEIANSMNKKIIAIVANRLKSKKDFENIKKYFEGYEFIKLPYDKRVLESMNKKIPFVELYPKSLISCNILNFASLISGNLMKFNPSFFEKLKFRI